MADYEVEIRSEQKILGAKNIGEIFIRGNHLAQGYWQNREETAQVFDSGWIRSGDLGYLDDEGYLFITGRVKDQINVDGLKVNPLEVERALEKNDHVIQACVTGFVLNEDVGEQVYALLTGAAEVSDDQLLAFCSENIEKYKVPQKVFWVSDLPKTDAGKLKRKEAQSLIAQKLGELEHA